MKFVLAIVFCVLSVSLEAGFEKLDARKLQSHLEHATFKTSGSGEIALEDQQAMKSLVYLLGRSFDKMSSVPLNESQLGSLGLSVRGQNYKFPISSKEFSDAWKWDSIDVANMILVSTEIADAGTLQLPPVIGRALDNTRSISPKARLIEVHLSVKDVAGQQRSPRFFVIQDNHEGEAFSGTLEPIGELLMKAGESLSVNPQSEMGKELSKKVLPNAAKAKLKRLTAIIIFGIVLIGVGIALYRKNG